jgi:maleylpyruvate isomerase
MILHGFWRSSATWRVRIALAYKQIEHTYVPVNLIAGEQHTPAYREHNPMAQVPLLVLDDGQRIAQSIAILEYLEEVFPAPRLLPADPLQRARVRQLTELVNAGIQPLQNTAVRLHVEALGVDVPAWMERWVGRGLAALEASVRPIAGRFCVGDELSFADLCLVPQLYFARRFGLPLDGLPTLLRIEAQCAALACFEESRPERQVDAPRA